MAEQTYHCGDEHVGVENGVTSLFSGARLVTSVDVPEDMMALVQRATDLIKQEVLAAARRDPWPCIVDEAYKGDPNKKLVRFAGEFYILDVVEIEKTLDVDNFLGSPPWR